MSIFDSRTQFSDSASSGIGATILAIVKAPLEFTKDIVQTPFNFVSGTVSGITTKVVVVVGLLIVGIFVIGKYNILGQVGKLR